MGDAGTDNADSDCVKKGRLPAVRLLANHRPDAGYAVPADRRGDQQAVHQRDRRARAWRRIEAADYSDLWGAGIGLDFDNPGGDAGPEGSRT